MSTDEATVRALTSEIRSPTRTLPVRTVRPYRGKRALDVVAASVLLILTAPLLALCVVLLKLGSRGPVLFGHRRCGRNREPFRCLKFRTMVEGAEEWLDADEYLRARHRRNGFKLPTQDDPRVTRVGHLLRRTHLDELPQLVNVLRGEMSLVGPRPVVEEELELFGERADDLVSVRPGIFGPWTALGRKRPAYPERCDVELSYVDSTSPQRDLRLLMRNLLAVLSGQ